MKDMKVVVMDENRAGADCVTCRRPVLAGEVAVLVEQGPGVYVHRDLYIHLEHFQGVLTEVPVAVPAAREPAEVMLDRYNPVERLGFWGRQLDREAVDAQAHGFGPHHSTQVCHIMERIEECLIDAAAMARAVA